MGDADFMKRAITFVTRLEEWMDSNPMAGAV